MKKREGGEAIESSLLKLPIPRLKLIIEENKKHWVKNKTVD